MHNNIKQKFIDAFSRPRIISLLYYGSRASHTHSTDSDYDFLALLDKPCVDDIQKVRTIIKEYGRADITLHYQSHLARKGMNHFQHGNHGIFFLRYLATAQALIGDNPFVKAAETITDTQLVYSLLVQIEEYLWRLNYWYFYEQDRSALTDKFRKYLRRILIDLLLVEKQINFEEVTTITSSELISVRATRSTHLSARTQGLLQYLLDQGATIDQLLSLKAALHEDYIALFENYLENHRSDNVATINTNRVI